MLTYNRAGTLDVWLNVKFYLLRNLNKINKESCLISNGCKSAVTFNEKIIFEFCSDILKVNINRKKLNCAFW